MATKTKPAAKKPAAKKTPAKKATKPKASEAPKAVELLESGTFVKFKGYAAEVPEDEAVFDPDDVLYIVEVDDGEAGALYTCIVAEDIAEFEENGDENVRGGQCAPSEVVELKGTALDKARDAYVPIAQIGRMEELLSEHDGDPIETAIALNEEIQQNYFYLGGALAMALQSGAYEEEYKDADDPWNEFCQSNFGFKASKGRQLARVYQTFSNIEGFDPSQLDSLSGWSIAAKIERYVTEDNYEEVLETASSEDVTQRNVDAIMQEKFVDASGKTASGKAASRGDKLLMRTMSFRLTEDGADSVDIALKACMKQHGIENEALALEQIVVEWAQDHVEAKTAAKSIQSKANKSRKAREQATAGATTAAKKAPPKRTAKK